MSDPAAIEHFTALYDNYHRRVYAYVVSRAGRQLADEVVSEVFLIAWRRLRDVPDQPLPWLLAVARNVLAEQFRAAARRQSLAEELRSWASPGELAEEDISDQVTQRLTLMRALATLADSDRELLTLTAWHGLSPRDAARVVGCSTASYFVRLHRARRRLQRAIELSGARGDEEAEMAGSRRPSPVQRVQVKER